jgi:hypothetical protein
MGIFIYNPIAHHKGTENLMQDLVEHYEIKKLVGDLK